MTKLEIELAFLNKQKSGGRDIYYFRHKGRRARLPDDPLSVEFREAYDRCLIEIAAPKAPVIINKVMAGSCAALVAAYLASTEFADLAPETRRTRRNILERLRAKHGEKRIGTMKQADVQGMIDAKFSTPSAARNLLNTLRALMRFAKKIHAIAADPTVGVTRPKIKTDGYISWEEAHIEAFEAKHSVGTKARLALGLLLFTAQRRADIVTMGRQHVRNGFISVKQSKTGTKLSIPMHPELQRIIDASNIEGLAFLSTSFNKPFTAPGFTNWFREQCKAAELPKGLSAHGLRKAACRRLAEAGCSEKQIASISGHRDIRETARYTRAADQQRMAEAATKMVTNAFPAKTGTQSGKS